MTTDCRRGIAVDAFVTGDSAKCRHAHLKHFGLGEQGNVEYLEIRWPNGPGCRDLIRPRSTAITNGHPENGNPAVSGEKGMWAEAQGWDAIAINDGTLDMSHRNALDLWGVHPVDAEAAFFFAWVAAEKIRQVSGN